MNKLFLLICIGVLVVSCRENQHPKVQNRAIVHIVENSTSREYYTVRHFFKQFDFNLSAIYGDVFSNKSWH